MTADCLFCKIVAGEIPATVVLDTASTMAFRDINPQAPTHVVVIPKAHHRDAAALAAADPALAGEVLRSAAEVARLQGIDGSGYRIVFNTGADAGQTVLHVHAHVLGGRPVAWPPGWIPALPAPAPTPLPAPTGPQPATVEQLPPQTRIWATTVGQLSPDLADRESKESDVDVVTTLERQVRQAQASERIPALTVALHRHDRPLWTFQVGTSGQPDRPLDAGTRFRMGSVTKTFTATLVMQCRDEGLLELDDTLGAHLPVSNFGDLSIRRLLSHTAGIQREPHGDVWDTLDAPGLDQLLADLDQAERVLPPARRFHYSNLGLSLLGHLVGRLRGGTWAEVLADRVLAPLGLADIVTDPGEQAAVGYLVDAYSDHVRPEPPLDFGAIGPAAQLWSTAADLARWAAFLADPATVDPTGAVLKESTLDEMRWPLTVTNETQWGGGFGLGLLLVPQGDFVLHVGHDGAMPGFLAGAYGRRGGAGTPKACAVAVLGSSGTALGTVGLPHTLLQTAVSDDPADIETWQPGPPAPAPYRSLLGRWWSEGFEYVFFWRDGALRARRSGDPAGLAPARFEPLDGSDEELRTISGREVGERLVLHRDPGTGDVVRMNWATYRFSRVQETFEQVPVSRG